MDDNDRQAIEGLFGKLSQVESQSGQRDAEAETLIRDRVSAQPAAPYFMAQTIVVQEQALNAAQQRIEQLEYEVANRPASGGGLFASLFGGGNRPAQPAMRPMQGGPAGNQMVPGIGGGPVDGAGAGAGQQGGPWGQQPQAMQQQRGGGGFLAGAAQTAMGVAGGMLLGNAIAGMFTGDTANAAPAAEQPQAEQPQAEPEEDTGADSGMDDMDF